MGKRSRTVLAGIITFNPRDFAAAEERSSVTLTRWPSVLSTTIQYLKQALRIAPTETFMGMRDA